MEFQAGIRLLNNIFKSTSNHFPRLSLSGCFSLSFFIFSSFIILPSSFAVGATVEALQMPAWLERKGQLSAIRPGMVLQAGDKLKTGLSSRLLLRMDEGSLVKLGENAQLDLHKMIPAEEEQGFFEAVLNVVKGAFRFTTTALGQSRKRQIDVRIGSITAGIRGTDIWGSSKSDKDILCLIEGEITAQRAGEPEFTMAEDLSFYIVEKDKPASPVAPVPGEKLARWADETELHTGSGVLSVDGKWSVNLMSAAHEYSVGPIMSSLTASGYAAQIEQVNIKGKNWYRLSISQFKTREDASTFAKLIDGTNGIYHPWVSAISK